MGTRKCELTGSSFTLGEEELAYFNSSKLPLSKLCEVERLRLTLALVPQPNFSSSSSNSLDCRISTTAFDLDSAIKPKKVDPNFLVSTTSIEFENKFKNLARELQLVDSIRDYDNPLLYGSVNTNQSLDCNFLSDCTACYDCIACQGCQRVSFSRLSNNCSDCFFIENCLSCSNCLFCTNLVNREYCVFNRSVTKQEYESILANLHLSKPEGLEYSREKFEHFLRSQPLIDQEIKTGFTRGYPFLTDLGVGPVFSSCDCQHSSSLMFCSGLREGFGSAIVSGTFKGVVDSALLYGSGEGILGSVGCFGQTKNISFSIGCKNGEHLFGCIGLKGAKNCILNFQLEEEKYKELAFNLEESLKNSGVYSNLFLNQCQLIPYNQSLADLLFPLNKIQAELLGFSWDSSRERVVIPDEEENASLCEISGLAFNQSEEEKEFLAAFNFSSPKRAPLQRLKDRLHHLKIGNSRLMRCSMTNQYLISFDKLDRAVLASNYNT